MGTSKRMTEIQGLHCHGTKRIYDTPVSPRPTIIPRKYNSPFLLLAVAAIKGVYDKCHPEGKHMFRQKIRNCFLSLFPYLSFILYGLRKWNIIHILILTRIPLHVLTMFTSLGTFILSANNSIRKWLRHYVKRSWTLDYWRSKHTPESYVCTF